MTDITKCEGLHCKLKTMCYRYTSEMNEDWQSMFVEPPCDDTGTKCEMFWGEAQDALMKQLKDITDGKD